MTVLSLFDGMSCGQIALERASIKVDNYIASELDKYAIKVTQTNYPETIQAGDVTLVTSEMLPPIDLLIGGSPCQGFSFAGKQLNFNDPRSKLFFEFVRLLNDSRKENPNIKFLLENVKMKKEYQDVISDYLGVQPIEINSALVSAQNRKRLYWTNIEGITQPEDKGILLKDILEKEVDKKYYHTKSAVNYMNREVNDGRTHWDFGHHSDSANDKSVCLTANVFKGVPYNVLIEDKSLTLTASYQHNPSPKEYFIERRKQMVILGAATHGRYNSTGKIEQQIEINGVEKSNSLTTVQKDSMVLINQHAAKYNRKDVVKEELVKPLPILASDSRGINRNQNQNCVVGEIKGIFRKNYFNYDPNNKGHDSQEYRAYYEDGKVASLGKGSAMSRPKIILNCGELKIASIVGRKINEKGLRDDYNPEIPTKQYLEVNPNSDKSRCLTTVEKDNVLTTAEPGKYADIYNRNDIVIRRLTPIECERLQTVPDNYTACVSNSQRYKMLGNGWTVDVIAHILSFLK